MPFKERVSSGLSLEAGGLRQGNGRACCNTALILRRIMYQGSASHEQVSPDEVEVSTLRRNARCCIDMRVTVVYASGMHKCSSVRLRRNSVEKMVNSENFAHSA